MIKCFELQFPVTLNLTDLLTGLNRLNISYEITKQTLHKTYYDSFDWRLFKSNFICEFNQTEQDAALSILRLSNSQLLAQVVLTKAHRFCQQFSSQRLRKLLEPILEMRALLAIGNLSCELYQIRILNLEKKTLLHLAVEAHPTRGLCLTLKPIKGYAKEAVKLYTILTNHFKLYPTTETIFQTTLKQLNRQPGDYSSKFVLSLDSSMNSNEACKKIYILLLNTLKANEQGVINNTDSEFLHDFRVAVRRTRSGLKQITKILPDNINQRYEAFFSWLGQETSTLRDMDVYLLKFTEFQNLLPPDIRNDLQPLHSLLISKQEVAQQRVAELLQSNIYILSLQDWQHYLNNTHPYNSIPHNSIPQHAKLSIKQVADLCLWKSYKRVIKNGCLICSDSPALALHELRKTCKKLRYLMEFFHSLYSHIEIDPLIKNLKLLQEVLGEYQDLAIQQEHLAAFRKDLSTSNSSTKTINAINTLILHLEKQQEKSRKQFSARFSAFIEPTNQDLAKKLFKFTQTECQ